MPANIYCIGRFCDDLVNTAWALIRDNKFQGTARSDEWLVFVAGMINHPGGKQICSDAEKMKMKMKRRELWKGNIKAVAIHITTALQKLQALKALEKPGLGQIGTNITDLFHGRETYFVILVLTANSGTGPRFVANKNRRYVSYTRHVGALWVVGDIDTLPESMDARALRTKTTVDSRLG
ncbi:hypothetical protein FOZG_01662 [Fusarium oxysporum Fo47]|uniref:DNA2/NAM7 helicase-like C-terminal domain-containing protein n=1 Tax=Fusarium oxysporum Fo47 TaxID=660027 RepID=W9LEX9_FUSOX|nr:hypothetical protein FOZG_01662 [Fusarium oxysporum Fo47]